MAYWSTGLCGCFDDIGVCCYGVFCPCCLYGDNANRIDGSGCGTSCCVYCLLTDVTLCCLVHMGKREALRQRFGLQEDCNDCVVTTFCGPCAICQEARELRIRGVDRERNGSITTQPIMPVHNR